MRAATCRSRGRHRARSFFRHLPTNSAAPIIATKASGFTKSPHAPRLQNEQYLELMETPDFTHIGGLAHDIGWHDDFGQMRDALLARNLAGDIQAARKSFAEAEALRSKIEHCGQPDEAPACRVQIRFILPDFCAASRERLFSRRTLLGFETASVDPHVVGLNFVMPEDGYTSMTDYALQMRMVGFLHEKYPKVHITLHAGELAPGLVTEEGLCCHIRLAVEQGHAERIRPRSGRDVRRPAFTNC